MMKTRVALILLALFAAAPASALNCKQMVGTWKITYKIITDWTDTVVVIGVKGAKVFAEDEFGNPLTAVCKKGVMFAVSGDSDFIVNSWYFTNTFGRITSVFSSDSIFDAELLSDVDVATRIQRVGGQPVTSFASEDDRETAKDQRNQARKAEMLQKLQLQPQ